MPRLQSESAYNNFVKGIITEAGPLTFPENASLDELNFVLQRDGSRKKRLGLDYETDYVLKSTGFGTSVLSNTSVSFHRWDYPKGNLTISLGIVRVANKLWFVNLLNPSPSTEFMNGGDPLTIIGLSTGRIDTAYINNDLILVGDDLAYPIKLSYDHTLDEVSYSTIRIKIRDFFGIDDYLDVSERPTTLSKAHLYNLKNQGWNDNIQVKDYDTDSDYAGGVGAIDYTYEKQGWYPSNADIWYYGRHENPNKKTFGYYVSNELKKNSLNNSQAPQGSFFIDFKNRGPSRAYHSGVNVPLSDTELGNLSCVAAYAGRVFYSGILSNVVAGDARSPNYSGYIFFTPTLLNNEKLDQCYQEADPTGEKVSDLIASDGGVIVIPEMVKAVKLVVMQDMLVVFAENGIWAIMGGDSGFKATDYQIKKISDSGTSFVDSIVSAEGQIYFWSNTGIYTVGITDQGLQSQNLSLMTIQTLYNDFSQAARENCLGIYEEKNSRIRWLLNTDDGYDGVNYKNKYNYELILDIALGAFYPLKTSIVSSTYPYIAGHVSKPYYALSTSVNNVTTEGVQVEVSAVSVTTTTTGLSPFTFESTFLTFINVSGTFYFTFSQYKDTDFLDWYTHNTTGQTYDCYLVTGYEIFKDAMRTKQIPYLYMYFYQTEEEWETAGSGYALTNPSSCLVQAQWDWTNSTNSNRWGTQFQAYKFRRDYTPSGTGTFNNGERVLVTKNRLRGKGKALSLYISAEEGKNLHLVGWAVAMDATGKPY